MAFTHGRGAFALVTPPTIIADGKSGNSFSLSFATLPGLQYTVQYKDSLSVPGWGLLQTLTSAGTTAHVTDSSATNSQRFYRLSVQP